MSPKGVLIAARIGLAALAGVAMMPLSYWGFLIGGGLGAEFLEAGLGSHYSLLGMVVGSVLVGGASLIIPAALLLWIDRTLERRLLGKVAVASPQ
jgi:hypothetical protein